MRTIAILAALAVPLATVRPAAACVCDDDCLPWATPIAYTLGVGVLAGVVGGYAYGTGIFIKRDLDGSPKSTEYLGTELVLHGSLGAMFTSFAIDAAREGRTGTALVSGGFAAMHLTLATNGLRGLWDARDQLHVDDTAVTWGVGTVTGINALYWASGMSRQRSRAYGLAEIGINAPFVAGYALLAKDRIASGATGPGVAYAGLAALSSVYIAHGVKTAILPKQSVELFGADVAPTVVSDTRGELAPGLATAGTF